MPGDGPDVARILNGSRCRVIAGSHIGKSGTVADRQLSETGHVTITVQQDDGVRFKTLARNVTPA